MSDIIKHLQDVESGGASIDNVQVKLYTNSIININATIDQEYFDLIFPIINRILNNQPEVDSEFVLFNLLSTILQFTSFDKILEYYSKETILGYLTSPNQILQSLVLKLILDKVEEKEVIEFLQSSDFLYIATKKYFTDENGDTNNDSDYNISVISTVSNYEELIKKLPDQLYILLADVRLTSIYQIVRASSKNILKARLLDFLLIVLVKLEDKIPSTVYTFTRNDFLPVGDDEDDDNDDPLTSLLIITFYNNLIKLPLGNQILENIKKSLYDLVFMFSIRERNFTVKSFYSTELVLLLSTWSYSENTFLVAYLKEILKTFEIFKSYNLYLIDSEEDVLLLSKFNPLRFENPDLLTDLIETIPLFSKKYFSILLNLVTSEEYFKKLIQLISITSSKIQTLPHDLLYKLLEQITKFKYSTNWLLTQHQLISDYVIGTPKDITDVNIWNLKKETLENLLWRNKNEDLEPWLQSIKETYAFMCNGNSVRNIIARPIVSDETG